MHMQSWIHGKILQQYVPQQLELGKSRGSEGHDLKHLMRMTVVGSDLLSECVTCMGRVTVQAGGLVVVGGRRVGWPRTCSASVRAVHGLEAGLQCSAEHRTVVGRVGTEVLAAGRWCTPATFVAGLQGSCSHG